MLALTMHKSERGWTTDDWGLYILIFAFVVVHVFVILYSLAILFFMECN